MKMPHIPTLHSFISTLSVRKIEAITTFPDALKANIATRFDVLCFIKFPFCVDVGGGVGYESKLGKIMI